MRCLLSHTILIRSDWNRYGRMQHGLDIAISCKPFAE